MFIFQELASLLSPKSLKILFVWVKNIDFAKGDLRVFLDIKFIWWSDPAMVVWLSWLINLIFSLLK